MLSGNNYSAEMADVLLLFGNFRWNVKRAITNGGMDDYGCYDLWAIDSINRNMAKLGKPLPYPNWRMLKLPRGHTETFGCSYMPPELDMLAARSEETAAAAAASKAAAAKVEEEAAAAAAAVAAAAPPPVDAINGSDAPHRVPPSTSAGAPG
jgi:hypothetical protein